MGVWEALEMLEVFEKLNIAQHGITFLLSYLQFIDSLYVV